MGDSLAELLDAGWGVVVAVAVKKRTNTEETEAARRYTEKGKDNARRTQRVREGRDNTFRMWDFEVGERWLWRNFGREMASNGICVFVDIVRLSS
jgi:hypothetical protein